jgi:hypothetical protein
LTDEFNNGIFLLDEKKAINAVGLKTISDGSLLKLEEMVNWLSFCCKIHLVLYRTVVIMCTACVTSQCIAISSKSLSKGAPDWLAYLSI